MVHGAIRRISRATSRRRKRGHDNSMVRTGLKAGLLIVAVVTCSTGVMPARAQDAQTVAREAKNPLANLVNVQFIYDANLDTGSEQKTQQC